MKEEEIKQLTESELQKVLYMGKVDFEKMSAHELKRIIITEKTIPAHKRLAAEILYKFGEQTYAVDFLIRQMNLYKNPATHKNIKHETCPRTAEALGRLQDKRAIEPLFEALGELAYGPAYGLAKINGPDVEKRLLELSESEKKEGIYAVIALGFMKNEEIVPRLVYILDNVKEIKEKIRDDWISAISFFIVRILGAYRDNKLAKDTFKKHVKPYIGSILCDYLMQDEYEKHEIEWEAVINYGWNKYLDTEEKRYVFKYTNPDKWVEDVRNEIIEKIWQEMIDKK